MQGGCRVNGPDYGPVAAAAAKDLLLLSIFLLIIIQGIRSIVHVCLPTQGIPVLCLLRDLRLSSHERLQNLRNLDCRAAFIPMVL